MSKKYTLKFLNALAKKRDGKCISYLLYNDITGNRVRYRCLLQCKNKHQWTCSAHHLINGSWCRKCFEIEQRNKNALLYRITPLQLEIIEGCLLGDGMMHKRSKGNGNSYFWVGHAVKQLGYLRWMHSMLKSISSKIREMRKTKNSSVNINGKKKKNFNEYTFSTSFQTIAHPVLTDIEKKWYPEIKQGKRIKHIPHDFNLTPLKAAIWYLDDGWNSPTHKLVSFATYCFSEKEVEYLIKELKRLGFKYCRKRQLKKNNKVSWKIELYRQSYFDFLTIVTKVIKPFPQCMRYKVDISQCGEIGSSTGMPYMSKYAREADQVLYNSSLVINGRHIYIGRVKSEQLAQFLSYEIIKLKEAGVTDPNKYLALKKYINDTKSYGKNKIKFFNKRTDGIYWGTVIVNKRKIRIGSYNSGIIAKEISKKIDRLKEKNITDHHKYLEIINDYSAYRNTIRQ